MSSTSGSFAASVGETDRAPTSNRPPLAFDAAEAAVAFAYRELFPLPPTIEPKLAAVISDALAHQGSLVRAQIAFTLLRSRGCSRELACELGIAIEYFHTASLLFDDLPSMDDARDRRGRPCPHRIWGEAAAILAALAFVSRGYALLWRSIGNLPADRGQRAADLVSRCLGVTGILNGQALDLQFGNQEPSVERVEEVADGKTVTLIALTLLLPAIIIGVEPEVEATLQDLARSWGRAYQIIDDFKDLLWTSARAGKSTARDLLLHRPNLASAAGKGAALSRLREHLSAAHRELARLPGRDATWSVLRRVQDHLETVLLGFCTEESAEKERLLRTAARGAAITSERRCRAR